jgi:dipeptidyl aminopeptidase/acylaminoacyl peptidase
LRRALVALVALSLSGSAPGALPAPTVTLAFSRTAVGDGGLYLFGGGQVRLLLRGGAEPAWSPDGRRLAYVAPGSGGASDLHVVDADGTHAGRITWTDSVDETSPSWSPDGRRLVVERSGTIVAVRADGAWERLLASGWEPAWSPRGRGVAFTNGEDVYLVPVNGGRPRRLTSRAGPQTAPAWAPDGRRLAFVSEESGAADVHVLDLRSGRVTPLTADGAVDGSPTFSADGKNVLFVSDRTGVETLWRVPAVGGLAVPALATPFVADPAPRPRAGVAELLPDLEQRPPADLSVKTEVRGGRRHFLLGFDSATDNVGLGPIVIAARRPNRRAPFMRAAQIVRLDPGGRRTYARVGVLRYVYASSHSHWHVMGFQRYELRRAADLAVLRRDRKSGFCLADHWAHAPGRFLNEPRSPFFKDYCERGRPDTLAVYQGTSVGYTDRYPSHFHGQNLDLTGIAAGDYVLVHRANRSLLFRELRYENNAASLRIRVTWPGGASNPPRVSVLRTCPNSDRC